jgi:hypothetical protein
MRNSDLTRLMTWCGTALAALCIVFASSIASAGESTPSAPDALVDLRTLFVEADGEVEVKPVVNMPLSDRWSPYWVDNHRIIYEVRQFKDWKAQKDERSKIIIVNVDTGTVEETPYRGHLRCIGPEGQILVQDYPIPRPGFLLPGDTRQDSEVYLTGKLGGALTRIKRSKDGGVLDYFACRFYDGAKHDFGKAHSITPLRTADGFLDVPSWEASTNILRLINPEGKVQWSIEIDKLCTRGDLKYLPWLDHYFKSTSWGKVTPGCMELNKNSRLFSTQRVEIKPLPKLIQELRRPTRRVGGYGETFWGRKGMYVTVEFSYRGFDGLYRLDDDTGQLKRVSKNPLSLDRLSPDGCRQLTMSQPLSVIELCKGDK